ncbi:MAG: hypothetical protein JSR46_12095 [Verrucomicrobia bacterium]|nr:hypothetical protein [Verrucomicrobiota bacterium]
MEESPEKKTARYVGIGCTLLYLALFFPSFYVGLLGPSMGSNGPTSGGVALAFVFMSIFVPFSLIASIMLLWAMYVQRSFRAMYFCCLLPVITALLMLFLITFLVYV